MLKSFQQIIEIAKGKNATIALAGAEDLESLKAIKNALNLGINAILVGNKEVIQEH